MRVIFVDVCWTTEVIPLRPQYSQIVKRKNSRNHLILLKIKIPCKQAFKTLKISDFLFTEYGHDIL